MRSAESIDVPTIMRPMHSPQRIMIRAANWIGDAVMSTPAIRGIRRTFPDARITLLAKPWVIPVFSENPNVDDIMVYDVQNRHAGLPGLLRLARDLRRRSFDTAILLQNAFEAGLVAWLAGIPRRIGYTTDGRALLLTDRLWNYRPYKRRHMIDYYLGILHESGMCPDGRHLDLPLSTAERDAAKWRLDQHGVAGNGPILGINPGAAGGNAKRWFPERFTELCRRLQSKSGAVVLIFGGPDDADLGAWMADEIGGDVVNLCGETTLREAMCLIAECRVFVTNDSGLMHVAAALDIPQVAIIGSTDHHATGPSNPNSVIARVEGSCYMAPCLKPECPIDHRCMRAVTVDMVAKDVHRLMVKAGGGVS